jgi:hypothetical protein
VFEGIEADAALVPGDVVAEMVGDKAVRGLMKGDGDHQRQYPDRYRVDRVVGRQSVIPSGSMDGGLYLRRLLIKRPLMSAQPPIAGE